MITVGITGGIGSGKTTVCKLWEQLGANIFYADDEAKKLMEADAAVVNAIKKTFGQGAYLPDGTLRKQHLIEEAFKKGRVEELNRIVHPAVGRKFLEEADAARNRGVHVFVKEAALMPVTPKPEGIDVTVVVASPLEQRVKRVTARDETDRESVIERAEKQPDFEKLEKSADFVLRNDGTLAELQQASEALFTRLLQMEG